MSGTAQPDDARARTDEALRASEENYRSLFDTMAEGFSVIELVRDRSGQVVDVIHHELNAALERQSGLRREEALGRRMSELQTADDTMALVAVFADVVETGRPATFEQYVERQDRWYEISAYPRGGDWLSLFYRDVSKRKQVEEALRVSEARHAFMLRLADALRPLADPTVIQRTACRLLGEHLGVDRAYYVAIDEEVSVATVEQEHLRAGARSLAQRQSIADFGWAIPHLRLGAPLVIADVQSSPIVPTGVLPSMADDGIAAHLCVPVVKHETLVGALCVSEPASRSWTADEVELVRRTADRIWASTEWARSERARRRSEERYRTLFDSIDEGFCIIELIDDETGQPVDYRFLETNPAFESHSGLREVEGRRVRELLPHAEQSWFDIFGRVARTGASERFTQQAPQLGDRWLDLSAFRIGEPAERRVALLFRDITAQVQADEALRRSEDRFSRFGIASSDVLWIRSADTLESEYLSPAFAVVYGREPQDVAGPLEHWIELVDRDDRSTVHASVESACSGGGTTYDYRIHRPDGELRWMRATTFPITDVGGRIDRIGGIERDITGPKEAEAALQQAFESLEDRVSERTKQVRELTRRLTMAEQEERRLIAAVLHDDLQQVLYGIESKVGGALADEIGVAGETRSELETAQRWIMAAIATTRRLAVDLSPPILRDEGLSQALQWLCRQMGELHGLHVEVVGDQNVRLPDDVRVLLFQMVRELLFNVKKHARTDRATVSLYEEDGELVIRVLDLGQGFDTRALDLGSGSQGFGLFSARERLNLLGGSLAICTQPGNGTEVEIRLPLAGCRTDPG